LNEALVAPVTVGKGATIGAGSTIAKDAPAGELTVSRARQVTVKGWDPKKIKDTQELIMTGVVKSEDLKQMELDRQAYKTKHGVDPPWAGDPSGWKQSVQNTAQLNESVNAARDTHGKNIGAVTDMNNRVEAIKKSPALDGLLKSSGLKKQAAKSLLLTDPLTPINTLIQSLPAGVSFTPEERGVIDNIRQLKGQEYGTALQRLSMSRPAASEITGIQQGLGQIQNFDLDAATVLKSWSNVGSVSGNSALLTTRIRLHEVDRSPNPCSGLLAQRQRSCQACRSRRHLLPDVAPVAHHWDARRSEIGRAAATDSNGRDQTRRDQTYMAHKTLNGKLT
jgi:hypothetical protein